MEKLIKINTHKNLNIFKVNDVCLIKAKGAYTEFYLIEEKIIKSSKNIKYYEPMFNGVNFVRFNRSFIININEISIIEKNGILEKSIIIFNNKLELNISYRSLMKIIAAINLKLS